MSKHETAKKIIFWSVFSINVFLIPVTFWASWHWFFYFLFPIIAAGFILIPLLKDHHALKSKTWRVLYAASRWLMFSAVMGLMPLIAAATPSITIKGKGFALASLLSGGELLVICAVLGMSAIGNAFTFIVRTHQTSPANGQEEEVQRHKDDTERYAHGFVIILLVSLCLAVSIFSSLWFMEIKSCALEQRDAQEIMVGSIALYIAACALGVFTAAYSEWSK